MSTKFVSVCRQTPMLLPPDLRDWVPEDDLVHFVIEAVERLPLEGFKVNYRGSGSEQYPPHMMLALLIYCYASGIFSSRRIERATHRDVAVRYLTGDTHPDHDTICAFRRENLSAVAACFVDVLELARELKLLKLGCVSVDGTHIKASASKDKNVTYERACQLRDQLRGDVEELLARAEQADAGEEEGQRLPEEIARREKLLAKMDQACARLEERAKERAERERGPWESKIAQREERKGSRKGPPPAPPISTPEPQEQINLSDADARLMRKSKREGYTQSYNAQAAVDAEGSQLILGRRISQNASDAGELEPDLATIPQSLGKVDKALADCGYVDAEMFDRVEQSGIDLYVSVHREDAHNERRYDYRPARCTDKAPKEIKDPRLIAMRDKLRTAEGKAIYRMRAMSVEPVFGIIKHVLGFRQFLLRGVANVRGEWDLVCLAYNIKRLFNLKTAAQGGKTPRRTKHRHALSPSVPSFLGLAGVIRTILRQLFAKPSRLLASPA